MEYEEIIEAIGREAADLPPAARGWAAAPRGEARHILNFLPS